MRCPLPVLCLLLLAACSGHDHDDGGVPIGPDHGATMDLSVPDMGEAMLVGGEGDLAPGVPRLRITAVDVGQGDGLVIQLPGGRVLALDGGPTQGAAYQSYLSTHGITRLDFVMLTHAHFDHYTGLLDALSLVPADCQQRVFDPGYDRMGIANYRTFLSTAGCRFHAVKTGEQLSLDPAVTATVFAAADMPYPASDNTGINNTSAVLHLRYGNFTALLEGDAQTEAEQMLWMMRGSALHSTVIKLGHHGSCNATGTTYLKTVAAQYALISAGDGNSYGHPHCQTMDKLKASTTHWLRTDKNGTISVVTDGTRYAVEKTMGMYSDPACPRACASPTDF